MNAPGQGRKPEARLPVEPLLTFLAQSGRTWNNRTLNRTFRRARECGSLTITAADRIAVQALGIHPIAVWGEAWLAD